MRAEACQRVANCAGDANPQLLRHCNVSPFNTLRNLSLKRCYHQAERYRRSAFWAPSSRNQADKPPKNEREDSNNLLGRAGFIRQAYSGIFHLLPLGLRVQGKIERLLEKHMRSLQASKVSLSSISSQDLWSKSGRLSHCSDVFTFSDRKDAKWLLSPTHEEEITKLVGSMVQSYRDLPVRLYQISRKYRDEPRPRHGLLRGREFLMKDLYTFDRDISTALQTYDDVRATYAKFFDDLKMPYIVAKADSGSIGGDISHEYHLPNSKGEDLLISCSHCGLVRNQEVMESKQVEVRPLTTVEFHNSSKVKETPALREAIFITEDKKTLVKAYCYDSESSEAVDNANCQINPYAVKAAIPQVAPGIENPSEQFTPSNAGGGSILYIFDGQMSKSDVQAKLWKEMDSESSGSSNRISRYIVEGSSESGDVLDLGKPRSGDRCHSCQEGRIKVQKAIEVGHTFHLGTRYSEPLGAKVAVDPRSGANFESFVQMGCHGIGVSRLIAATASALSDNVGLNWPRVMAPFEVIVIPHQQSDVDACFAVYDQILHGERACSDAIVDDRQTDWLTKLREADLTGYPVIVFLGQKWKKCGEYEVQCRRLNVKQDVPSAELSKFVKSLLDRL